MLMELTDEVRAAIERLLAQIRRDAPDSSGYDDRRSWWLLRK
ncbi:MAG: hypothetical protein AB7N70_18900 [Dehalococcoidia bacterium]